MARNCCSRIFLCCVYLGHSRKKNENYLHNHDHNKNNEDHMLYGLSLNEHSNY
jgi:hypothetical protein